MQPQAVERPAVQAERRALGERPAEPGGGEAEGARLRQDRHLARAESGAAGSTPTPYHSGSPLASTTTRGRGAPAIAVDRAARAGARQSEALGTPGRHHRQMAGAADQRSRRCRPGCARPGSAPASPSSPMPMTLSQRFIRAAGQSALTAAAASALPPRRPRERDIGEAAAEPDQRRLGLGGADKADRKAEDQRRPRGALGDDLEEMKQRGRRVADRDDGARRDAAATARPRRPSACCAAPRPRRRVAGSRKRADHLVSAGSRSRVMPAATIALSTRIGAPAASAAPPGRHGAARPGEVVEDRDIAGRMRQPQRQRPQRCREPREIGLRPDQRERAARRSRPGRAGRRRPSRPVSALTRRRSARKPAPACGSRAAPRPLGRGAGRGCDGPRAASPRGSRPPRFRRAALLGGQSRDRRRTSAASSPARSRAAK